MTAFKNWGDLILVSYRVVQINGTIHVSSSNFSSVGAT